MGRLWEDGMRNIIERVGSGVGGEREIRLEV